MINEEYDVEGYNQLMMSGKITLSPIEGLNLSVMGAMQRPVLSVHPDYEHKIVTMRLLLHQLL